MLRGALPCPAAGGLRRAEGGHQHSRPFLPVAEPGPRLDDTQPAPTTPQVDDTENSWNGLSDPTSAFSGCLGWGPGTAGSSLKSAAAAASMMEWADANGLAGRSGSSVRDCLAGWYDALDTFDQENVAECWPLIQQSAQRILDDPEGAAAELSDAGVQEVPACSQEDWSALAGALNAIVPEPMQ